MTDNFKQVVNLQDKPNKGKINSKLKPSLKKKATVAQVNKKKKNRAQEIDQVYSDESTTSNIKKELSQIDRPKPKNKQGDFFKQLSLIFFIVIVAMIGFYFFINKNKTEANSSETALKNQKEQWYSVQLINKEVYYGLIIDTGADPVVLDKVYYNYNQTSGGAENDKEETSSKIRLIKRGKEAHGPSGTMDIVRSQVLFMEPLSDESKILKAILDYEK